MLKLFRSIRAKFVVPRGDYCYEFKKIVYPKDGSMPFRKVRKCPYWCWDKRYPNEDVGYCKYLKIGDRDEKGSGILFDQVKECGVNDYE